MVDRPPLPLDREAVDQQEAGILDLHGEEVYAQGLPPDRLVVMQQEARTSTANTTEAQVNQFLCHLLRLTALGKPSDEGGIIALGLR